MDCRVKPGNDKCVGYRGQVLHCHARTWSGHPWQEELRGPRLHRDPCRAWRISEVQCLLPRLRDFLPRRPRIIGLWLMSYGIGAGIAGSPRSCCGA